MLLSNVLFKEYVAAPAATLFLSVPPHAKTAEGWTISRIVGWALPADVPAPAGFPRHASTAAEVQAAVETFGADVVRATTGATLPRIGAARAIRSKRGVWRVKAYVTRKGDVFAPHTCGAPTRSGGHCGRKTPTGERCWQHR